MILTIQDELDTLRSENKRLRKLIDDLRGEKLGFEGQTEHFTDSEHRLIAALKKADGKVLRHATLHDVLYWDRPNSIPDHDVVKVHISKIRKKLKNHKIVCEWGIGYRLEKINGVG